MSSKPVILALNRNPKNLEILTKILKEEGYDVMGALNQQELEEFTSSTEKIDMAILDISGFNKTIWDSCEHLRVKKIPFLVLSPHQQKTVEKQGMLSGAKGVMTKPLAIKELLFIIKNMIDE
jgi:DNA-binding response OmpR family regulator